METSLRKTLEALVQDNEVATIVGILADICQEQSVRFDGDGESAAAAFWMEAAEALCRANRVIEI